MVGNIPDRMARSRRVDPLRQSVEYLWQTILLTRASYPGRDFVNETDLRYEVAANELSTDGYANPQFRHLWDC